LFICAKDLLTEATHVGLSIAKKSNLRRVATPLGSDKQMFGAE
jgi:hypothetical protein